MTLGFVLSDLRVNEPGVSMLVPLVSAIQGRVFIKMAPSLGLELYMIAWWRSTGRGICAVRPLADQMGTFCAGNGEIARVYVRRSGVRRHVRTIVTRFAGVALTNGNWVDIGAGVDAAAEARAVGWTHGVEHLERGAPRWGMVARRAVIPLAGAMGLCWLWASYH